MLGAALAQLPASLTWWGASRCLFGWSPGASWPAPGPCVGAVVAIKLFGQILRFSGWVLASPRSATYRGSRAAP